MADVSGITNNYYTKAHEAYSNNLSSSIAALATTVPVNSAALYSNGDYVVITVEPGTANQATFYGQKSGTSFVNCVWTEGNLAVGHSSGAVVVDYISATHWELLRKAIMVEHDADGTHGAITPTSIAVGSTTWANLITGWLEAGETWTYVSPNTFTISGDVTAKYTPGTKIRLIQSASTKYFYVIASAFGGATTVITIALNTSYTLANAVISSPFYSYAENPQSFPREFNYTPTFANLSGGTLNYSSFDIKRGRVHVRWKYTLAGAGVAGSVTFSTPTPISSTMTAVSEIVNGCAYLVDTGVAGYLGMTSWSSSSTLVVQSVNASTTTATSAPLSSTVPHTWGNLDVISVDTSYQL
jgi:hypothetical protein